MAVLLVGCGPLEDGGEGGVCEGIETPAEAADCSFDGECSSYLVCIGGTCQIPEAMTGRNAAGSIEVEGETFDFELAESDVSRMRGLTGRPCMADGWGLLLEWPREGIRHITMTGMLFDLDVYWLDSGNEVVGVQRGLPAGSKALFSEPEAAQRVLEVRAR